MRLPKIIEIIKQEKIIADYDRYGNPIYDTITTYYPIKCDVEPFGKELSEKSYGVFVDATHRVFTKPNELIKPNESVRYKNEKYKITKVVEYDKHFEVMLKKD